MKKIKIGFILISVVLFVLACPIDDYDTSEMDCKTFEEISQPYLDQYGPAEDVDEYKSDDYHSIDWWWWSKGFMVCFLWTTYDDICGWTVDHTYSFTPF